MKDLNDLNRVNRVQIMFYLLEKLGISDHKLIGINHSFLDPIFEITPRNSIVLKKELLGGRKSAITSKYRRSCTLCNE